MVLPLLFALGGQFLAGATGASLLGSTALATGLSAAGGNALGQLIQNGEVDIKDAALAGVGGGISAGLGGAGAGVKDAAAAAYPGMAATAPGVMETGIGAAFSPTNLMQTGAQMGAQYLNSGIPGYAATMMQMKANTPKPFKGGVNGSAAEQERLKAMWGNEMAIAMNHEANNNSRWYAGDPNDWFRSRGFEDGGVVPSGIGLPVAAQQAGAPGREAVAKEQTQELFDIAILILTNKLPENEKQDAMNLLVQSMGPEQAQQFLQSVEDMLSGYADQKGEYARPAVKGFARGGVKREMGKPAETFAGLPMERAGMAARQDLNMLKNLVIQMSLGNLSASQYQSGLQTLINAFGSERKTQDFVNATMDEFNANGEKQFNSDKLFSDQVDAGSIRGPYVIAGAPSDVDNVMARDAQTGEPIKLASGEAILPAAMVEAAGGGIAGAYNIVNAAAQSMPHLRPHAKEFMNSAHT